MKLQRTATWVERLLKHFKWEPNYNMNANFLHLTPPKWINKRIFQPLKKHRNKPGGEHCTGNVVLGKFSGSAADSFPRKQAMVPTYVKHIRNVWFQLKNSFRCLEFSTTRATGSRKKVDNAEKKDRHYRLNQLHSLAAPGETRKTGGEEKKKIHHFAAARVESVKGSGLDLVYRELLFSFCRTYAVMLANMVHLSVGMYRCTFHRISGAIGTPKSVSALLLEKQHGKHKFRSNVFQQGHLEMQQIGTGTLSQLTVAFWHSLSTIGHATNEEHEHSKPCAVCHQIGFGSRKAFELSCACNWPCVVIHGINK